MRHGAPTVAKYVIGALALAALVALAPFFIASGLMAPGWAVALFIAVRLALFVAGCVWIRRRPLRVIPLPFVAVAIWFGGMTGGELLGWTLGAACVTGWGCMRDRGQRLFAPQARQSTHSLHADPWPTREAVTEARVTSGRLVGSSDRK